MKKPRPSKLYKTGEVLKRAGISREVFYRYLNVGLIRPARTSPGGHNLFSDPVFRHIELIRSLNGSGFTLRDIKDIYFRDERIDAALQTPHDAPPEH
ncbi:MAG TPA: MerR family transcriptional regulator [Planctomycetota bacterium]|nr:MerR family transcriptional regulator [Planctomycetota bacterium]